MATCRVWLVHRPVPHAKHVPAPTSIVKRLGGGHVATLAQMYTLSVIFTDLGCIDNWATTVPDRSQLWLPNRTSPPEATTTKLSH